MQARGKRAFSFLLAIVLVIGLCPSFAYAAQEGAAEKSLVAGVSKSITAASPNTDLKANNNDSNGFQRKALRDDCEIISISAGNDMSAAVRSDGTLWTWGCGSLYQKVYQGSPVNYRNEGLGIAAGNYVESTPTLVFSGSANSIVCSEYRTDTNFYVSTDVRVYMPITTVLKDDGSLWAWGGNGCGVLGNGGTDYSWKPIKILDDVVSYDTSGQHSAAVTSDGSLYVWGKNSYGMLGLGTTDDVYSPTKIDGMDNVVAVSLGGKHSAALKADGSLWTWGSNSNGQLGNGTNEESHVPIKVLDDVKSVSLGESFSIALKTDGTVWAWGDNSSGQLGNGTTGGSFVAPAKCVDIEDIEVIEAGAYTCAAIQSNGTLQMWGSNRNGQLGNNKTDNAGFPEPVLRNVNSVAVGATHTLAVKQDGTLWAWGANSSGQLGDHSTARKLLPVEIQLGRIGASFHVEGGVDENKTLDVPWDDKYLYYDVSSYNNNLSIAGIVLSEAAYSNSPTSIMGQFGFTSAVVSGGSAIDQPKYLIGYKATWDFDNPNVEVMMIVRGTQGLTDWLTNLKSVRDAFDGPATFCYDGLKSARTTIANKLSSKGITLSKSNTKYFITGHSLGGACAGRLALKAVNDEIVKESNTYVYTFASPNYASAIPGLDGFKTVPGLYNIINTRNDVVPKVPSHAMGGFIPVLLSKAGKNIYLYPSDSNTSFMTALYQLYGSYPDNRYTEIQAHKTAMYLACVMGCEPLQEVANVFSRIVSIHCPVDIQVFDSEGELRGYTENGVAYNTESSAVCIATVEDEKYVSIPADGEYTIKYVGVDEGTMKIEDQIYDLQTGEIVSEEVFENVVIEDGKKLESSIDGSAEEADMRLLVVDDNEKPVKEVLEDGTEVDYLPSGIWGSCKWEISADGELTIEAGTGESPGSSMPPWFQYRDDIKSVKTTGTVVLPDDCSGMFERFSNLVTADLSGFDTSNVASMNRMFEYCSSLKSLVMAGWDTSNVTDMDDMFAYCESLESIDLSHFSTANATKMSRMFNGCESLEELDLSTFDTSKASSMRWTFGACFALKKVTVGDRFSFLSGNDNVSAVLPGTSWHSKKDDVWFTPDEITANRNNIADVYTRPAGQNIAEGIWGTCEWTIDSDFVLTIGPGVGADSLGPAISGNANWPYADWVKEVKTSGTVVLPRDCTCLFANFGHLTSFDAAGFDSSPVESMKGMFMNCFELGALDLSGFHTSNVTDMSNMFSKMVAGGGLKALDLSGFDTANVTNMNSMFGGCDSLEAVYVGDGWSTANVEDSSNMFSSCASLVGGNGTAFDENYKDAAYARVDADGAPGYLTYKAPPAPVVTGWVKADGKWYYYRADGTMVASKWEKISGKWYHFDANGAMETSKWIRDSKGWCYVGASGAMVTNGWAKDSKGWCYMDANGYAVTSKWLKVDGKWYYFDANSRMVSSKWVKDSKGWVYLDSSGAMATDKWVKDSKGWCYVGSDGYAVHDQWKKDSKGWCYLDENCRLTIGWKEIKGTWYYFDANGRMVTGTQTINGKTYRFADNGAWLG